MIIKTCVVGVTATNCYIVINQRTKEAVIVDPGDQSAIIIAKIKELEVEPIGILLTHGHFDHIMATNIISKEFGIKIYASKLEQTILSDPSLNSSAMIRRNYTVEPDVLFEGEEIIKLAGFEFEVINTPGHTSGGVSYYLEKQGILFSGDTLFHESIGRTDFPTGDIRALNNSIVKNLFKLPKKVEVYPGHGQTTTIGHEMENNPFVAQYL